MIDIRRWNFKTKEYEPYEPNPSWVLKLFVEDLDEGINCAGCGLGVIVGDCYTSLAIHTFAGFGYLVCHRCYAKELEERWS